MKQDVVEYMVDSFVDFRGEEHKIVACALSQTPEVSEYEDTLVVGWMASDCFMCPDDSDFAKICRVVSIGIAVCNPADEFDEERGKAKAYNKALHDPKCPTIYTKSRGVVNKALVEAFLKQEIGFIKENPERIIKGYNQMKARFDKKAALENEIKNLNDAEKAVLDIAKNGVDIAKCAELIEKAKSAGIELNEQG